VPFQDCLGAEARTNLVDIIGTAEAVPFQGWQGLKPIEFLGIFGTSKLVPLLQSLLCLREDEFFGGQHSGVPAPAAKGRLGTESTMIYPPAHREERDERGTRLFQNRDS
jgi:hypothetical protein